MTQSTSPGSMMTTFRNWCLALIVLAALSIVFQLVGVLTPGWLIYYIGDVKRFYAVWYIKLCQDDQDCEVKSLADIPDDMTGDKHRLTTFIVPTTISIACTIGGLVMLILMPKEKLISRTDAEVKKCFVFCITAMMMLIAGVMTMVVAGRHGSDVKFSYDQLKELEESNFKVIFPYSVLVSFLGGLCAAAVCFVIVVARPWRYSTGAAYPDAETINGRGTQYQLK